MAVSWNPLVIAYCDPVMGLTELAGLAYISLFWNCKAHMATRATKQFANTTKSAGDVVVLATQ